MSVLKILWAFLTCLPEIIRMLREIQAQVEEAQTQAKVKESVKEITSAFKEKDADRLRKLFNS